MNFDAQPATNDLTVFDDRLHNVHRQLGRNGKADALRAAGLGKNRGIDADQIAAGVYQRTARVTRVDGRIGLNEVFVGIEAQLIAPGGTDDPHGHGLTDPERVADGQCNVADANAVRARDGDCREVFQVDLEHCQIGFRIIADDPGNGFAAVF